MGFEKYPSGRMGEIYRMLWSEEALKKLSIAPKGKNSYAFIPANREQDSTVKTLIEQFGIKDEPCFKEAFKKACSGAGDEGSKILTVHSSSLCALLHFYSISNNNKAVIEIEGNQYCFSLVTFEFKNRVISGASNVDVVLLGEKLDSPNEKVVLFLESKFAEYITDVGNRHISKRYYTKNQYGKEVYESEEFEKIYEKDEKDSNDPKEFILRDKQGLTCYIQGIKQMISHYIGIRRLVAEGPGKYERSEAERKIISAVEEKSTHVLLGEVLFADKIGGIRGRGKDKTFFEDYKNRYKDLAEILNKVNDENRFQVVKEDIEYRQFDWIKEDQIRKYYYQA